MSEKKRSILSQLQNNSSLSKRELLLRGLELLERYYTFGFEQPLIRFELRQLEEEAVHYAKILKRIRRREEAIRDLVQELRDVEEIMEKYGADKNALIQILLDIQARNHWLPKPHLMWVAERLGVPLARIYQIASFYKAFSLTPKGRHKIRVCLGTACYVRKGQKILEAIERTLCIKAGETTSDGKFSLESVNCMGCCALGPVIEIDGRYYGELSTTKAVKVLSNYS